MQKITLHKFNKGEINVWFYVDNIRYYDDKNELIEKNDKYVCFFKFTEPTFLCLGELIQDKNGNVMYYLNENNALNDALNYVKNRFNLED